MPQGPKNDQKRLMGGVVTLMPAAILTKVVGLFYRIPLIAIVGVEGMAYFLAAGHAYSVLFVLLATGLPTALSLQVSRAVARGEHSAVRRILGVALSLFLLLGAGGTALLFFAAPQLSRLLSMEGAAPALAAVAPALLLAAFVGAGKGYFQGLGQMLPTALCEVIEALAKLILGLLLALFAKGRGMAAPAVAAFAILGVTLGLLLSALLMGGWLTVHLLRHREKGTPPPRRALLAALLREAVPITVSASIPSLVSLIDTALISGRLQQTGMAPSAVYAVYSAYGNLALPLYHLVPSLLAPLTMSLMPLLSAALTRGERHSALRALRSAMRLTVLIAVPSALGLGVFAAPILTMIYGTDQAAVAVAAPLLVQLAISVLPAALIALTGAALQAAGRPLAPVLASLSGALAKLAAEFILLPHIGISAAPQSTLICNLVVLLVQAMLLAAVLPKGLRAGKELFATLLAAALSVGGGAALYFALGSSPIPTRWLMLPPLLFTVALFLPLSLLLGALRAEDLCALPMGERLCALLQRHQFIK
ncbi:MAG: hypothetical protein E7590_08355 [Ruminococcaceae bacterium]|nr:hypothetical protein [Oscillospiraceae bacterium]